MRLIRGERLEAARNRAGLNRPALARAVGMHPQQLQKLERAKPPGRSTSEERVRKLAEALGVAPSEIAEEERERPRAPIVVWAERQGISRYTAIHLAIAGRIEGARKEYRSEFGKEVWVMEPDARRLPPTEEQRAAWRRYWQRYNKSEYNRERRRQAKRERKEDE